MTHFYGRHDEMSLLNGLFSKRSASLVVVKGRRRIGKSSLIEAFGQSYTFYNFTGVPPTEQTTDLTEKHSFIKQLRHYFKKVELDETSWWDALWFLAEKTKNGKVVILFDEISWMATKDPNFLGILKTVWDTYFKKNSELILVLCGSVSTWINKNILTNTGFVGRISLQLTLRELPLNQCDKFFNERSKQLSSYEKLKFLAVCGGIPRYLEEW